MGTETEPEIPSEIGGLESISLDEAIAILGEQTRMEIIIELGKAWDEHRHQQKPLGFSELMDAVGASDSGRFNYHLDKLVGSFVSKAEEGYWLLDPGMKLYRMLVSGILTERELDKSIPVDDCPSCGGMVRATYREDNSLVFKCEDCNKSYSLLPFSPRGFEHRSDDEALDAAFRSFYSDVRLSRQGICPACHGNMKTRLTADPGDYLKPLLERGVIASMKCKVCNNFFFSDLSATALTTDEVRRFLADHGIEAALVREWHDVTVAADESVTVAQEDPLRVEITFSVDDERIDLTIDEDLQIVASERSTQ